MKVICSSSDQWTLVGCRHRQYSRGFRRSGVSRSTSVHLLRTPMIRTKEMPGKLLITREFWNFWNLVRINSRTPQSAGLFIWPRKLSFLTMFQKEGPMVHRLWSDSNVLLSNIMEMFVKKAPNFDKDLKQFDLNNRSG